MGKEIYLIEVSDKKIEQIEYIYALEDEIERVVEEYFEPLNKLMPFYYLKDGRRCFRLAMAEELGFNIAFEE